MTRPSWQDFGTHDESIVPELWDGVVGAWAPCLGPTGSRLHDVSRRSNWGTLTNMDNATDWVVSDGQYALDFDGSNDYVPSGKGINALLGGQLAVSAWVLCRNFTSTQGIVGNYNASGNRCTFNLEFARTAQRFAFFSGNNYILTSTTAVSTSVWTHVVGSRSGVSGAWEILLAVNAEITSGTTSATIIDSVANAGDVTIGRSGDFAGNYLNGRVADVTIWNRPLSINEIRRLYQLGRGGMYQRRRRSRIYIPQAGFQAAWARGSNVLLGFQQP